MTQGRSHYDNAIAERINGILKDEFGIDGTFENLKHAVKAIENSISIYNHLRPHFSNHMLTPHQMHEQNTLIPKKWCKKLQEKELLNGSFSCNFLPSF